ARSLAVLLQQLDLARERFLSAVKDRRTADPKTPRCLDLVARFEKQSSSRRGVRIKVGEVFAILAAQDHRGTSSTLGQAETAEAVVGEGEPVASFGVFAFIDDVYAGLPLALDNFSNGLVERQLRIGAGKTADMSRQDALGAAIHGYEF